MIQSAFRGIVVAAALATASAQAAYPEKGLTLIVAYGAGGGTDTTARLLAKDLESVMGQPVTVQNVTGGGGWNGWSTIAHATPDGYTIGYINIPNIYAGYLDPNIGRPENLESFTPLMNHVTDYCIWAVRPDSPFQSVGDVIEAANANPGSVSITAHGYGNDDHLAILAMQDATGAEFRVVHNKSTADSKSQVLGGHVDVLGGNVSEVFAQAQDGELRVLGVMAAERSQFLPDVPTFTEQGFEQVWSVSRGIAGPGDLPPELAGQIIDYLEKTISSEAHQQKAADLGLAPEVVKGEAYRDFLKRTEQDIKKLMGW
ncbi:MAG: tripartite tricarboxylate transporter substrate binding protein [Candidatus Competibacterales bacterium]|nr:tripartite tricarboxylate transporter substrate binding protein [Candidatus Competibacterales bacterium]